MNFNPPLNIRAGRLAGDGEAIRTASRRGKRRWRGRISLCRASPLRCGTALASGAWSHYEQHRQVVATAEQGRDFVPQVRVATVRPSAGTEVVSLPATTSAFAAANIFARASGYIDKREVDIGDHVKAGQLLAEIVAPELDHQIAQAEATLGQLKAALQQAQANRELAKVTWDRDGPLVKQGWLTAQQGTIDVQTLKAQEAAVSVAQANVVAEEAQLQVLHQQKLYQRVVAPFDGVITQRNIDIGSLVQADATSGTFMFTIMQGNVIRTQVFVPQDEAFGLKPGNRRRRARARDSGSHLSRQGDADRRCAAAGLAHPADRDRHSESGWRADAGNLLHGRAAHSAQDAELHGVRRRRSSSTQSGLQVAVVENGVVHLRKVTVVRDLGQEVEINSGVKAGDQVILNPAVDLADGSKVRIRAPATRTS